MWVGFQVRLYHHLLMSSATKSCQNFSAQSISSQTNLSDFRTLMAIFAVLKAASQSSSCNRKWRHRQKAHFLHCTMCTLYSIFTSQLNKLRPTVKFVDLCHKLYPSTLDAIAFPSTFPCQSVGESLIVSNLEIAISSPSFASLLDYLELDQPTCCTKQSLLSNPVIMNQSKDVKKHFFVLRI